jgi:DNA (cytosine-5)-methyltransferase 1
MSVEECLEQLPVYAQTATSQVFPPWKIRYIAQNREFWENNYSWLKSWRKKIETWDNSHQKLEWNCKGNDDYQIKTKIVQFRASGIRVKLPTFSPALNLVGTQVPILPWIKIPEKCIPKYTVEDLETYGLSQEDVKYGRYLTTREAAALQGMETLQFGNLPRTRIYEALGNAVNTQVVKKIAERLIELYGKG